MNAAGTAYLVPQATTFGPFLPSEIAALFVDAAGLQDGGTMSGQKANEALCRSVSQARADGADIERWLGRSALVAVMGALVESLKWKKPIDDVLYGHECENDVGGFVGYCRAAGQVTSLVARVTNQSGVKSTVFKSKSNAQSARDTDSVLSSFAPIEFNQ